MRDMLRITQEHSTNNYFIVVLLLLELILFALDLNQFF